MADRADLLIYQGDDYAATVIVSAAGVPPDQVIAGYTAKAQIREDVADQAPEVVVEIGTEVATPNVFLAIPAAVTAGLCETYKWDLQLTSPEGVIVTVLAGRARVTQEVTRPPEAIGRTV